MTKGKIVNEHDNINWLPILMMWNCITCTCKGLKQHVYNKPFQYSRVRLKFPHQTVIPVMILVITEQEDCSQGKVDQLVQEGLHVFP